jgi:hypothetical protein
MMPRASVLIALGAGFTGLAASAIALWANPSPVILAANLLLVAINAAVVIVNLALVRRLARTESAPKRERVC